MEWRFGLALGVAVAIAPPLWAELFSGFYKRSEPPVTVPTAQAAPVATADILCLREILAAEARYEIPGNLLLAIGIQEAGRGGTNGLTVWPWTLNANGKGTFFVDREEMLDHYQNLHAQGQRSIDVGCMQINQRWHGKWFGSVENAADPYENVDYAARYLLALHQEEGDWWEAAGRYHSSTPEYKKTYLAKLVKNQKVAEDYAENIQARVARLGVPTEAAPSQPAHPEPGVFWSSTMNAQSDAHRYTIYSNAPIRAVLPGYKDEF